MEYIDADSEDVLGEPFWQTAWWSDEMQPAIQDEIEQAVAGE